MTTAADILADAMAADDDNTGIVNLLTTDPDLERLVAVWSNVPLPSDPQPDEECPPDLPRAVRLRWVWSRLEPDPVPVWIALAGLPDAPHVRRAVTLAIDNRIVFPNGALSTWARVYLQQQARRTLGIGETRQAAVAAPAAQEVAQPVPASPELPGPLSEPEGMISPRRRLRRDGEGV